MIVQQLVVDAIVAAAALWLVWSFGPDSLRRAVLRKRRVTPGYDVALQADALAGRRQDPTAKDCGPDCGCG